MAYEKNVKRPNLRLLNRLLVWRIPVFHYYALRRLEKWYFEDEPKLYTFSPISETKDEESKQ